jgi:uncharacterized protein (TIGR02145 family)
MKRNECLSAISRKVVLLLLVFILCFNATGLYSQIPTNGLVAWYKMDGNIADSSGNGYNGINNGATATTNRYGISGKALINNGTTNFQSIPFSNLSLNAGTINLWFKINQINTNKEDIIFSISKNDGGNQTFFIIDVDKRNGVSKDIYIDFERSGTIDWNIVVDESVFNANSNTYWNCLTVTHNGTTPTAYLNGINVGTLNTFTSCSYWWDDLFSASQAANYAALGCIKLNNTNLYFFNGSVDDIRIYSRALTGKEIKQLYYEGIKNTLQDLDGNIYKTVKIGNQLWMAENLNSAHYNDGTLIPNKTDGTTWAALTSGARCYYNIDSLTNSGTYGAFYNWHAVNTQKLCPVNWHVPVFNEWITLDNFLGSTTAGGNMKETGLSHWASPNLGADNISGFTALPAGLRSNVGLFVGLNTGAWWWSSDGDGKFADYTLCKSSDALLAKDYLSSNFGMSVRCLSNPTAPSNLTSYRTLAQINLKWNKSKENDVVKYRIYRGTSSNAFVLHDSTTSINDTSKIDTYNISSSSIYFYCVTAVNNAGYEGEKSKVACSLFTELSTLTLPSLHESGAAFADYDNDGRMDLLISGNQNGATFNSQLFRNDGSNSFTFMAGIGLSWMNNTSIAFGDYDNNGYLDFMLSGYSYEMVSKPINKLYKNNANGSLTLQPDIVTPGIGLGNAEWGDYDNDGDLDIIVTGTNNTIAQTKLFQNNGASGFSEVTGLNLEQVKNGVGTWGDYDNDGLLDLMICGGKESGGPVTTVYKNNGNGTFTKQSFSILGIDFGKAKWVDYNGDGFLDIMILGSAATSSLFDARIYKNNSGTSFTDQTSIQIDSSMFANFTWGDIDNDGDYDLITMGDHDTSHHGFSCITRIYRNDGASGFVESNSLSLPQVALGSVSFGDIDNDKDLDLVISGMKSDSTDLTKIFVNNTTTVNTVPTAPKIISHSLSGNQLTMKWHRASDDNTPQVALSYNLRVGTTLNGCEIMSPQAAANGYRRITGLGNAQLDSAWTIKNLKQGKYYWSVQAIDQSYVGGAFSAVDSFVYGTQLCGIIDKDSTLTKAKSPYFVSCNLGIDKGATLTIDHGVTLIIDQSKKIVVNGTLIAKGTKSDSIIFTNNGVKKFDQIFIRSTGNADLDYVKIENDSIGIYAENSSTSTLNMNNCRIINCVTGIEWRGESITIDSCEIASNSGNGLYCANNSATYIANSFIQNNAGYGIKHDNATAFTLLNCKIKNNTSFGIFYNLGNSTPKIINNSNISDNGNDGINGSNIIAIKDTITNNQRHGMNISNSSIRNCYIANNTLNGLQGPNDTLQNNVFSGNFNSGIYAANSAIWNNSVINNKQHGIITYGLNEIKYNTINNNTLDGINTGYNDTIKYNNIKNNGSDGIETSALPLIQYNNICGNTAYNIHATKKTSENITATNNYFCTTNTTEIGNKIYDYVDDSGITVKVNYTPFKTDEVTIIVPPSNLAATANTLNSITLSWLDNTSDETGFEIQRSATSGTGFTPLITLDQNTTNYTDNSLSENTNYYYRIRAKKDASYSEFSSQLKAKTHASFEEQTGISLAGVSNSSVAWGDYDNDGDLDILLTGHSNSSYYSKIYKNDGYENFIEQNSISLFQLQSTSVAWGDYDNNGYLDILLTGENLTYGYSKIYQNNGNQNFTEQISSTLTGIQGGSVAWADYNNDGDLDILLAGSRYSKIYKNNGDRSFSEQNGTSLTGVSSASIAWADYNKDGYFDFLLTGNTNSGMTGGVSKVYSNNGNGSLTEEKNILLYGVYCSSVAWGDYDNDGFLDIILTGSSDTGNGTSKVYHNNGNNTFTEQNIISLDNVTIGSVKWGDFNNDGYLDIFLTGSVTASKYISKIYINNRNGLFTEQTSGSFQGVKYSSVALADYDNDGDLDILLTGSSGEPPLNISKIYRNNTPTKNTPPSAPASLGFTYSANSAILRWKSPTDDHTPSKTLSYNVYLYSATDTIVMPNANLKAGFLKTPDMGNAQLDTFFIIKGLVEGAKYYWSVQAIDQAFKGGRFAPLDSFVYKKNVVTSIAVYAKNGASTVYIGGTLQMFTNIIPKSAPDTTVTWSVSNIYTATISNTGLLTPIVPGTVTIMATAKDGSGVVGSKVITILNKKFDLITFEGQIPTGAEIVTVDSKKYLKIRVDGWKTKIAINPIITLPGTKVSFSYCYSKDTCTYQENVRAGFVFNADTLVDSRRTIFMDDPASVSYKPILFNVIADTLFNFQLSLQSLSNWNPKSGPFIYVSQVTFINSIKVNSIQVLTKGLNDVKVGNTIQLYTNILPKNAADTSVTWTVSNVNIATISITGLLTAKAVGSVTVTATAKDGSGIQGSKVITIISPSAVNPPTSLKAVAGNGQVILSWTNSTSSNIKSYRIYSSTTSGNEALSDSTTSTTYTKYGLRNNQQYYFYVTAVNLSGSESDPSNKVNCTPIVSPNVRLVIKRAAIPPVINGQVDNSDPWSSTWIDMTGNVAGNTSSRVSAKFQLMYDNANLYLITKVIGDNELDTATSIIPESWQNDNLEVYVALDTNSYAYGGAYLAGDYQFRMRRGSEFPKRFDVSTNNINLIGSFSNDVKFKIGQTNQDDQYIQEWQMPWSTFLIVSSKKVKFDSTCFKFENKVSDNTTGLANGRTQMLYWRDNTDLAWNDTRRFSLVALESPLGTPDPPKNLKAKFWSGKVLLSWNKNKETNIKCYRAYVKSKTSDYKLAVDNITDTAVSIQNLSMGVKYYFTVTAVSASLNESNPSSEVYLLLGGVKPQISAVPVICPGENVKLTITNPNDSANYIWYEDNNRLNDKSVNEIQFQFFNRTYTVVDETNGMTDTAKITWRYGTPSIDKYPKIYQGGGPNVYYFATDPVYASYQWYMNGSPIGGANKYYYVAKASDNGVFYVKTTIKNMGCPVFSANDTLVKTLKSKIETVDEVSLFPNPAGNELNITITNEIVGEYDIVISDLSGRPIQRIKINKQDLVYTTKVSLNNLASGYYVVDLITNMDRNKRKMFVKR